ncbi:hypothetical protein [Nonomuraea terrae]|uniref:hypothetical protein n=1 Tax=Nonomuraea terrae TaxID=2530383 RepID=UPI001FE644EE|nr:hypothetical protein [Nonomuraea terrae]
MTANSTITGSEATVVATGKPRPHHVEEFVTTVRSGDQVWARDTLYSRDGQVRSRPFVLPEQDVTVDVSVTSLPEKRVGTQLRLMAWNLFVGGTINRTRSPPTGRATPSSSPSTRPASGPRPRPAAGSRRPS